MIRVICADISDLSAADYRALYEKAAPERKARADGYRAREDALRCVAADALLRYALGTDAYTVEKTALGKPCIQGREDFHYNLSHSGNWVMIAFGDSEVGVDVEKFPAKTDIEAIARRFFTPEEQDYIFREEYDSSQRFLEVWTGKESYLKYLGIGLTKNLTAFSVLSLEPEVKLHHRILPDGSHLTLCAKDPDCRFEQLDLRTALVL